MPEPRCEICGGPLESAVSDAPRCARCLAHPPRYRIARTVARYRTTAEDEPGSLPALIRRHKYGLDQSVGRALVEYMGDELPVSAEDYDVVIPVPLHWRRLWWRGFNQAALLADEVAHRLDLRSIRRRCRESASPLRKRRAITTNESGTCAAHSQL